MKSCRLVFDLNSSLVRNVLRGWNAHGDIAAVWMTQPLTSFTAACLPKACHQAKVVGLFAELSSDTPRQSLVHWATNNCVFQLVLDLCAFGLPFKKRFTLFSVNVPVYLQLARRCDDSGHVCSFFWQNALFSKSFSPPIAPSSICCICCSCAGSFIPCQGQLDKQAVVVRLNHGQEHRWGGRGLQCAVIRAESS